MSSRRARGEGTVVRDGDGWIARIELPVGSDGKRRRRKRRARTKSAAFEALKELQAEYDALLNPDGESRTVEQAVRQFLDLQPKDSRSEQTVYLDEWRGSMIVAGLGRRRLGQLTVQDCDRFLSLVRDGDFGSRPINRDGVRRTRSLLVKVLRNEMRLGNLGRNVADLSVMPVFDTGSGRSSSVSDEDGDALGGERRSLSHDELSSLLVAARPPYSVVVELVGRNGLRPSEARGLRWSCIDLGEHTLMVNRQMSSGDELVDTKTKRARRTVRFDEQTAQVLTEWRARQADYRNRYPDRWLSGTDLVVTTRHGTPINRNNLKRSIGKLSIQAGLAEIVPYELRHTAITLQLDAGHEVWRVADWAGTSERMIEEAYRHRLSRVSDLGPVSLDRSDGEV